MLRGLVFLLLMLNLGYLVWGQGWLLPYGMGPTTQREPQRLARQLHPEAVRIVVAEPASQPREAVDAAKPECLQSAVLDAEQAGRVRTVLQNALPSQAWAIDEFALPSRWVVYMGKYANAVEVDKKRAELTRLGVTGESPRSPVLAPGLVLGTFDLQSQADTALKIFAERGVRTARVLQDVPTGPGFRLRLPAVNEAMKAQLPAVRAVLPSQALQPCAVPSAPD